MRVSTIMVLLSQFGHPSTLSDRPQTAALGESLSQALPRPRTVCLVSDTTGTPKPRSADQIEADIAATRDRIAGTLDTLQDKVKPENLVKSGLGKVKGIYIKEDGGVRIERVAATAALVVGVVLLRKGLNSYSRSRVMKHMPDVMWVPVPKRLVPLPLQSIARFASV